MSPAPAPAADGRWSIGRTLALTGTLAVIVLVNFGLRRYGDRAGLSITSFLGTAYRDQLPAFYSHRWWEYFLPLPELTGSWTTTSLVLVHGLEHLLGSPVRVYYLTNAILIIAAFGLGWAALRSYVFATTLALCFALGTYNYHVYLVSGTVAMPLVMTYLLAFLFCQFKLLQPAARVAVWGPLLALSLLVYLLSYESWLDCAAWMWVAYPAGIALALRAGDRRRAAIAAGILAFTTLAAGAYVLVKLRLGHGQAVGSESDIILNYGRRRWALAGEDLVSHFFTLFYITATTYCPPQLFSASYSLWRYGPEEIVRLQHGYHATQGQLVVANHLFLWRYYTGAAAALAGYGAWRAFRAAWAARGGAGLAVSLLLLMTLLSGATHMVVKYRPMHSAPFLGYHSYFGIVGLSLLLAYGLAWVHRTARAPERAWALTLLVWANLGYCALTRPALLSHLAQQCGFGPYPDPLANLRALLGF